MNRIVNRVAAFGIIVGVPILVAGCQTAPRTLYVSQHIAYDQFYTDRMACGVVAKNAQHTAYTPVSTSPAGAFAVGFTQGWIEAEQSKKAFAACMEGKGYTEHVLSAGENDDVAAAGSDKDRREAVIKAIYLAQLPAGALPAPSPQAVAASGPQPRTQLIDGVLYTLDAPAQPTPSLAK